MVGRVGLYTCRVAELAFTPRSQSPQPEAELRVAGRATFLEEVSLKPLLARGLLTGSAGPPKKGRGALLGGGNSMRSSSEEGKQECLS